MRQVAEERAVEKVRLQKRMRRGCSATIEKGFESMTSSIYLQVRTKDTGLGWLIADQKKSAMPVTMWYPDDTINPWYMNSRVVLQVFRHKSTSGPNLSNTRQSSIHPTHSVRTDHKQT